MVLNTEKRSLLEIVLVECRWIFVCFFLLPISFLYNLFWFIRNVIAVQLKRGVLNHDKKLAYIQQQVQNWRNSGMSTKMCTARPGWKTMSFRRPIYKNHMYRIECNLFDILAVDTDRRFVRVEPQVTMGQLTATLSPIGWSIPIVPELDDLTVGGLVMGTGIESSSHAYGLFQHICVSYELCLADGSTVNCSANENADLFAAVPWSYGTLGLLTAVDIRIVPISKYVKLRYELVMGLENICRKFEEQSKCMDNDFVEGIMYDRNEAVIMTGQMVADENVDRKKINKLANWYKPWFYVHARDIARTDNEAVEYIPLRHYYHRHSRSLFWELQDIVPFGNHPVFRWLLGWLMPVKVSLLKLTQTKTIKKLYENNHIIQDLMVPVSTLGRCIDAIDDLTKLYPLWLCPFKLMLSDRGMVHPPMMNDMANHQPSADFMYVDIGIYGVPKVDNFRPRLTTRKIEDLVADCHGYQMLYADTYRSREEFRQMFDHTLYDRMRKELNCENAFPVVYDKVNKNVRD